MAARAAHRQVPAISHSSGDCYLEIDEDVLREQIIQAHQYAHRISESGDKEAIRSLHTCSRDERSQLTEKQQQQLSGPLAKYFASGNEIDPKCIQVGLVPAEHRTPEGDLFTIARKSWSLPFSKGYGRRLRYLVMDTHHDKLIGIIGLQSPPADLGCRDRLIGLKKGQKKMNTLNAMLDAYTVGAVPPYSQLIGGKLVAGLLSSDQIRTDYWKKYGAKKTEIRNKLLSQPLIAITTTSAYGRSSIYNRLKHESRLLAEPIGYTKGYGSLHLEMLYPQIIQYLKSKDLYRVGGYGNGPRIRWQNIAVAQKELGLPSTVLHHGIQRQVFMFRHVRNLKEVISQSHTPDTITLSVNDWSEYWKQRWAIPRSERNPSWADASAMEYIQSAIPLAKQ